MTTKTKYRIGFMIIVAVILIAIFWRQIYDSILPGKESRATFDACAKFAKDCSGKYGTPAWTASRCDVLWESCTGTWQRNK